LSQLTNLQANQPSLSTHPSLSQHSAFVERSHSSAASKKPSQNPQWNAAPSHPIVASSGAERSQHPAAVPNNRPNPSTSNAAQDSSSAASHSKAPHTSNVDSNEKDRMIGTLRETVGILQEKIHKLELLVALKEKRIQELSH
jgi:hypothetical protein